MAQIFNPSHQSNPLYNGNIALTQWKTKNTDSSLKTYDYTYDALNRIKTATDNTGKFNLTGLSYDKNGNIMGLVRQGQVIENPNLALNAGYGQMDNLVYAYDPGNKLLKVTDNANDTYGFKDGTNTGDDFTYDQNGNMLTDANKGITNITYNHLNLPTQVFISNPEHIGNISYIYDASGVKLTKITTEGSSVTTTEYAGNFIYENNSLRQISTAEGYVEKDGLAFRYVYYHKDHQNNIRLTYSDLDGNGSINPGTEILHERNYYPFGLVHKGYNSTINGAVNNYKQYQGQEYTEDLELNIHEWKFRFSDPAIGRFWSIDPLVEEYSYQSPYNFSENRVIDAFELEGLEKVSIHNRAFHPDKTFGGGFSGDDRVFTTSSTVTSRVRQTVDIDFDQTRPIVSGGTQTSDPSHHPILGNDTAADRDALKNVQTGKTITGAKQVSFQTEIEGANPLTPAFLTPNIDVDGVFSISSNQETGTLSISAIVTGDKFPSAESFISDSAGNSVFIGVSALQGDVLNLKGDGGKEMINTNLRINFNSDGVFQNVIYQGQQYNIQDYNKLFETQNPNGN